MPERINNEIIPSDSRSLVVQSASLATRGLVDIARIQENVNIIESVAQYDIFEAIRNGDVEKVQTILHAFPQKANQRDEENFTPLHYLPVNITSDLDLYKSCKELCPIFFVPKNIIIELVKILIKYNADVNAANDDGDTPLHLNDDIDIANLLIIHGANVNAQNKDGEAPIHIVTNYGRDELLKFLLLHGADINLKNDWGLTPLHYTGFGCIAGGFIKEISEILLENGADINAKDNDGLTPLHLGAKLGIIEFVKLLIKYGANINLKTIDGKTPLDLAKSSGHIEVVDLLLAYGAIE